MNKIVFSILVAVMLLLSACGGKTADTAAKTEVSYMGWGDPAELEVWNKIIADFQTANRKPPL